MAERIQCSNYISPLESLFILIIFLWTLPQRAFSWLPQGRAGGEGSMRCDSHLLRGFCCACGTGLKNTDVNNLCYSYLLTYRWFI